MGSVVVLEGEWRRAVSRGEEEGEEDTPGGAELGADWVGVCEAEFSALSVWS